MSTLPRLRSSDAAAVLGGALTALDPSPEPRPFAVSFWDGSSLPAEVDDPQFTLEVRSRDALAHLIHQPDELGAGRAWVSGALDVDGDLEEALSTLLERFSGARIGAREKASVLAAATRVGALRRPPIPASEARPAGARHTPGRDAQAVRHHYDVPSSFYRLLLGPSMVYSCAAYDEPSEPLEVAQERKLEMICRKLDLQTGERFLDVGCGWGSLLMHAVRTRGVRAVGVTLSGEQAAEARRRIEEAGLSDQIEVRVQDYRDLAGEEPFDAVASVGMYEHVGRAELADYVLRLRGLLRVGGRLLNHGITLLEPADVRDTTFTARYVFPDGELHPLSRTLSLLEDDGFELRHVETLRESYPHTLRAWARNLDASLEEATAIAGEERVRVWRLYLRGAALGFEADHLAVYQTLAVKLAREPVARAAGAGARVPAAGPGVGGLVAPLRSVLANVAERSPVRLR